MPPPPGGSSVLVMVHWPALPKALQFPVDEYPDGMGFSVAVHVGSPKASVTVNIAGLDSEALAEDGDTVPLAQVRLTVTEAGLLSLKSLSTRNVKEPSGGGVMRTLTIVHCPTLSVAEQFPVDEYPGGIGLSMAVHVGSPLAPVTVNTAGLDSEALAEDGDTVPLPQLRLTVTEAGLLSLKSLWTVKFTALGTISVFPVP